MLIALSELQKNETRYLSYEAIEGKLTDLLEEFGVPAKKPRPNYPFWRMRNDEGNIWVIPMESVILPYQNKSGDVTPGVLKKYGANGGFSDEIYEVLIGDKDFVNEVVARILDLNFPESVQEDILDSIGFPWIVSTKRKRDPKFKDMIQRIYEQKCAICDYQGKLNNRPVALEAAHVQMHSHGGPDTAENGVLLCSIHHKIFDRGGFTFSDDRRVMVSQNVLGGDLLDQMLIQFNGKSIRTPIAGEPELSLKHIRWHQKQLFKGNPRKFL